MNRKILLLAIPNIVTNITIPLLGMVDLGLMGHLESAIYIGAIAIGSMIFNFLFWGFGFLRMGTSGFTAQAFGSRNLQEAARVLVRAVAVALGAGILMILLQFPITELAFLLIGGSPEVEILAREYFYIRIYAAPATLIMYALTGWFIGMQNARTPMILAISINVLNILFSLSFIYFVGMKSDGIALANVLSQCAGILLSLLFLQGYFKKLKKYFNWREAMNWQAIKPFVSVNKDIFIRTLCLIFVLSFFTTESAGSGDTILAVNTLLFQFFYFFSYFIDGYAYAAEALSGRYIGARDTLQLKRAIRLLFFWGFSLAGIFTLIYGFGGDFILGLLTNNQSVIEASQPYLFWIFLIPFVTFSAFLWDGIYVGATASVPMRNSMVIITIVVFLPAYYLLREPMGNNGLWLATMIWLAARGISLWLLSGRAIYARGVMR
ncbi:MAG: MATE family efflux transporter [Bacteroidales bacterium]|nr:MATE family efflux transporter [Bacteroidales bacterium]